MRQSQKHGVDYGDVTDLRFLDPKGGHIVGLFPKGEARYDKTGFVRELDGVLKND